MALTILRGYTDQQVQLNILEFCDLTGPTILAILHIFLVCFSGDTYGSHIIILVLELSSGT